MFVVSYVTAQQWFIECPYQNDEDVVFLTGDMSGYYNYSLGYRYDKTLDVLYPYALCMNQGGDYVVGTPYFKGEEAAFNSAIGLGNDNIFVTAYSTDDKDKNVYEKMWITVLNPSLDVLYENYVIVEKPYLSFGYVAQVVVNDNNEFVVLVEVAENIADGVMTNCDLAFYKFDDRCNLLSISYLENNSYNSDISDFVYDSNLKNYVVIGRTMSVTGVNSVLYVDEDFNVLSCIPIDNPDNYPSFIRPYFVSVGKLYDDNSMLLSMQTKNTASTAEYCPLVLKVDKEMNILDSIKFERYGVADYVSQYNSIVYVNPKIIYVSSFEVKDISGVLPNTAMVSLIDEELNMIGRKTFELGCFMNIMYIQPTIDGGCIVQAYYERDADKVAVIYKLTIDDFNDEIVVDEYRKKSTIKSYPNPVSSILNIMTDGFEGDVVMVKVFDISGRRCLDEKILIDEDASFSLDLSSLCEGLYYYSIIDEDNNVVTKTFVKE